MILHGRNLIIKAGGVAIAAAKSCDINVQCEEIETASPSTGEWRTAITGRKSWSVTTNQLVTSLVRPISMVGTTVSLSMEIKGEYGSRFGSFVDNPTLQEGSPEYVTRMVWDKTRKKFLACYHRRPMPAQFYENYSFDGDSVYSSPSDGDVFYELYDIGNLDNDFTVYVYYNGNLHAEKMTGNANVVNWRVTGTVGNLAQGSFQFNGNGALTPAVLPST